MAARKRGKVMNHTGITLIKIFKIRFYYGLKNAIWLYLSGCESLKNAVER